MAELVCPLPQFPRDSGLLTYAAGIRNNAVSRALPGLDIASQQSALNWINQHLQEGLSATWTIVAPQGPAVPLAATKACAQNAVLFKTQLDHHLIENLAGWGASGGWKGRKRILNERYVVPSKWETLVETSTKALMEKILDDLWKADLWPASVIVKANGVVIELQALTPRELEVREKALLFDNLVRETSDVTTMDFKLFRYSSKQMVRLMAVVMKMAAQSSDAVRVPPRFLDDALRATWKSRLDLLTKGEDDGKRLSELQRQFEEALHELSPIELRGSWEGYNKIWPDLDSSKLLHWLPDTAPGVPSLEILTTRFQSERPRVMTGCLQQRMPRWETICGASNTVIGLPDTIPLLFELSNVEVAEHDSWMDRLGRLVLLSLHSGITTATEPLELDWLALGAGALKLLSQRSRHHEACQAVARQLAIHIAQRPDLVVAHIGSTSENVAVSIDAEEGSQYEQAMDLLNTLLDVVTSILADHHDSLEAQESTDSARGALSELAAQGRPLMAWLQGDARPWFMVPGTKNEFLQSYSSFLGRMERVTGLVWVGFSELDG